MLAEVTYPHIEKLPSEPARLSRLTRVRVAQIVMDYLGHGWSPDELCRHYPHLTLAEVHAAMGYYYDHQAEIEREIEAEMAESQAAHQQAGGSTIRVRLMARGLR